MEVLDECIYCGQALELAEDNAWVDIDSGRSGCGAAAEAGEPEGEHVPAAPAVNTMDAAGEIRLVDVQIGRFPDGSPNPYEFGC